LFICPCHGATFDIHGTVLKGPAQRDLDRFPMQVVDAAETIVSTSKDGAAVLPIVDLLPTASDETLANNPDHIVPTLLVQVDTGKKIISAGRATR